MKGPEETIAYGRKQAGGDKSYTDRLPSSSNYTRIVPTIQVFCCGQVKWCGTAVFG